MDLLRQEIAVHTRTLIVKVGTRVLTRPDGTLDEARIAALAEQISELIDSGRRVALVSSGAVAAGMSRLGWSRRPTDLAHLQAVAAIGQARLIEAYDRTFQLHGRQAAQILLTGDDFEQRTRYLNVRNTLLALLEFGAVPVINENDTVAVEELMVTFGDNDRLAAMVTNLIRAQLLVILSDVPGLYDGDPAEPGSQLIPTVPKFEDSLLSLVRDRQTGLSKGGMASKLQAARIATTAGENVIIASGREPDVLRRLMAGEPLGTLFLAQGKPVSPMRRWIGFTAKPRGRLTLDPGACRALREQGRSLLAIGVREVQGLFQKGDVVALVDETGRELARGLTNYSAGDLMQIIGRRSDEIAAILGKRPYEEVIHRDNMTLL